MSQTSEQSAIIDALDTLLTAISQAPQRKAPFPKMLTASELMQKSEVTLTAEEIVADPVGRSLRLGIEALGERLNEIGGMKAMHAALDEVVSRDPARKSWRANILDKRWDGIGEWHA